MTVEARTLAVVPRSPETAWPIENVLFGAALTVQRIPWIDLPARALGLRRLTREELTRQLFVHLRRTNSDELVELRTPFGVFLTPLSQEVATGLLGQVHTAGACESPVGLTAAGRRYGISAHAAPPLPGKELAGSVGPAVQAAADQAAAARGADGTLPWPQWSRITQRLARSAVLGAAAADDTLLSEILTAMIQAGGSRREQNLAEALYRRLLPYLSDPEGAATRIVDARARPEQAVPVLAHVLALVSGAVSETAAQALALLAVLPPGTGTDPVERALGMTLRHYPPLAATVHRVRSPFQWNGMAVRAGTEILHSTAWLRELDGWQDESDGSASLCAHPSACPAAETARAVTRAFLGALTQSLHPVLYAPRLHPDRLPHALEPQSLKIALADRSGFQADGSVSVGAAVGLSLRDGDHAAAHHAALARRTAGRLEAQAGALVECAQSSEWNNDAVGEHFRMVLLGHAERCFAAAADMQRTADRLAR